MCHLIACLCKCILLIRITTQQLYESTSVTIIILYIMIWCIAAWCFRDNISDCSQYRIPLCCVCACQLHYFYLIFIMSVHKAVDNGTIERLQCHKTKRCNVRPLLNNSMCYTSALPCTCYVLCQDVMLWIACYIRDNDVMLNPASN